MVASGGQPAAAAPSTPLLVQQESTLDSSFFPSPPAYYKRYTTANLALDSSEYLTTAGDEAVSAAELQPPNLDWVKERGHYTVFGQTWPIEDQEQTLRDTGLQELFDSATGGSTLNG